ncbi:MAG: YgiW/YdeI family stress tolerance OB fold protein [Campylobacteraceae bacterium]
MKKSLILAGLLLAGTAAFAEHSYKSQASYDGGFTGPSVTVSTVVDAKNLKDHMPVALEGKIVQHLGKDKYLFRDATGDTTIEIDHKDWRGVSVNAEDMVVIYGEVDKSWFKEKIEVYRVVKK